MNADHHRLARLMHKPERDPVTKAILPPENQDKCSVVPLAREHWDVWLNGTAEQAMASLQLPPLEVYQHGAEDPGRAVVLPLCAQ